ncbi:MAG TPA: non-ribosomal peptide synthetase, partial [Oceanospirillales bacterium]|nr:non-ribosomal peptide synthetase [Oceanospirillales bacterium]
GPTETHVATSALIDITALDKIDSSYAPPIGKILTNLSAYVLDQQQQLVPFGVVGELYLAGSGLAQGYLNQPELSSERFLQHQFSDGSSQRLYRTGDLVRYQQDGNLAFIGRADEQIKIRGFRIELGEIEQCLCKHSAVQEALVIVHEKGQEKSLIAYLSSDDMLIPIEKLTESLKAELSQHLPEYMIPVAFIRLEHFPLTENGKIDRHALPIPSFDEHNKKIQKPSTKSEQKLAQIWAYLLKIPHTQIGQQSNFFALGGHSLLSVRLLAEIRDEFNTELTLKDIFVLPQLKQLAQHIAESKTSNRPKIVAIKDQKLRLKSSYAQQRLWFIDQMEGGSGHYNMPSAMRIKGNFDTTVAQQAFRQIIARHESLRTVFIGTDDGPMQQIKHSFDFSINETDLSNSTTKEQRHKIDKIIMEEATSTFDLSKDLMLRVNYIKLEQDEGILLFNVHHIAFDGWSASVLIKEFSQCYKANHAGQKNPLAPLNIQYADYAYWQRNWLDAEVLETQLDYWKKKLKKLPQIHGLPLDYERP